MRPLHLQATVWHLASGRQPSQQLRVFVKGRRAPLLCLIARQELV